MNGNRPNGYMPQPIVIDGIEIGEQLAELIDELSKNAHELWAAQRFTDGWSWGEHRDDKKKTHPCLIHYDELPDTEKVYDRKMVVGTLQAIIALGYSITRDA